MWKREEVVSSSDESLEEEVSHGVPGGFETAAGACKLKPVFDDIFADIRASIPTLDLEDSSEVRNNKMQYCTKVAFLEITLKIEPPESLWQSLLLRQHVHLLSRFNEQSISNN